ncbi:hypothetical protein [Phocaeicola barnesiae]|uniref:hypothetical protein n=1 Tax=Phocaeicola barnesiae TaxID=376804 RepID=UPI0026709CC5|nr:hypothetical protein [Phocaeicola barnesiae]
MENLAKEKYETPVTKWTRVEMESGICVASDHKPDDDVSEDRHVSIAEQNDGGSIGFKDTQWE